MDDHGLNQYFPDERLWEHESPPAFFGPVNVENGSTGVPQSLGNCAEQNPRIEFANTMRPMALAFENLKSSTRTGMRFALFDKEVLSMPNCHGDTDV